MTAAELTEAVALMGSEKMSTARAALDEWGHAAQLRQVQEECAELIAAINRAARGRGNANMIEEAGQVWFMLLQLREIIGHERFAASVDAATDKARARLLAGGECDAFACLPEGRKP